MIAHKADLRSIGLLLMGIFAVLLVVQFAYLLWLRFSGTVRKISVNGKSWNLLYRVGGKTGFGSFRLIKGYILWSEEFDLLPQFEKDSILQHEISHLRQYNTWELIGLDLLRLLWFANPVIYLLKNEWRKLSEFIADADAIEQVADRAAYAKILLDYGTGERSVLRPSYVAAFRTHPLKERIGELANATVGSARLWPALVSLALLLSIGSAYSTPVAQQEEQAFQLYEVCYCINLETGQLIFCDDCLTEGLDCACVE